MRWFTIAALIIGLGCGSGPASSESNTGAGSLQVTGPTGVLGVPYSYQIQGHNCSLTSGQLPLGLTVNKSCVVSGTPTLPGTSTFTVATK